MNLDKENISPATYRAQLSEDEISLVDIFSLLFRRKKLILSITTAAFIIGLLYAFTQERVYQVETILRPPSFENIQGLNVLNDSNYDGNLTSSNDNNLTSSNVFATFIHNLNSRRMRYKFFNKHKILDALSGHSKVALSKNKINGIFESFSKSLSVKEDKKAGIARVSLVGAKNELIGSWLDDFITMTSKETIKQLVTNVQLNINSRVESININISSKRTTYKQRREDQLARLKEAYQIAKELKIIGHLFVPSVEGSRNEAISSELNSISKSLSNENNLSVYMKGTKVLQAEINALKNRKSDSIHIIGLRDLQEQLTRLQSIKIETKNLKSVDVDKMASVNIEIIGPKRKLIVMLSIVLGGMLGIFSAFILEFTGNLKKQVNN